MSFIIYGLYLIFNFLVKASTLNVRLDYNELYYTEIRIVNRISYCLLVCKGKNKVIL
ncbi:hypothetical protein JCM30760_11940 [Thiomicrorhabdus hydrogeniphila]